MSKKYFLVVSLFFLALHALFNIFALDWYPFNLVSDLNGVWLEPSLNWSLTLVLTGLIGLIFRNNYFHIWLRRFFIWYFPFAYLLTFTFPTYGGLMETTKSGAAIMFGALMVFVTVVWVGYSFIKQPKQN